MLSESKQRRQQGQDQAARDAQNALMTLRNVERFLASASQQLPSSAEKTRRFLEDERNRVAHQATTLDTLISKQRLTGVGGLVGRIETAVAPLTRQGKAFEEDDRCHCKTPQPEMVVRREGRDTAHYEVCRRCGLRM